MAETPPAIRPLASNRRALHDYFVHDRVEAGLVLTGTEVKSCRMGKIQLRDGHVAFRGGEAFLEGVHISPYSHGHRDNPLPDRERKLLLSRREIDKLGGRAQAKGFTVVPLLDLPQGRPDQGRDRARPGQEAVRQARDRAAARDGPGSRRGDPRRARLTCPAVR